jgi:hypothetical protein
MEDVARVPKKSRHCIRGHIEAIDSAGVEYRIDRDSTNDGKPVCKLHAEQSKKYKSITLDEVALY